MAVSFLKKVALAVVPLLYHGLATVLFATCRVEEDGRQHYDTLLESGSPFSASFWHYSLFFIVHRIRRDRKRWVAMVSTSDDAEFVSLILQRYGVQTVRGSRNRRGIAALKEMISAIKNDKKCGAIVADGSQGPALELQPGVILLASKSGGPVLPVAWATDRYWAFGSWDRTVLPKPFAKIYLCYGEPVVIPPKIKAKEVEGYRLLLQEKMLSLYQNAWSYFGRVSH